MCVCVYIYNLYNYMIHLRVLPILLPEYLLKERILQCLLKDEGALDARSFSIILLSGGRQLAGKER